MALFYISNHFSYHRDDEKWWHPHSKTNLLKSTPYFQLKIEDPNNALANQYIKSISDLSELNSHGLFHLSILISAIHLKHTDGDV